MNRWVVALLSVLIFLVALHGFLVWRVAERAQAEAERQSCLQRVEATAVVAMLVPTAQIDPDGRLEAMDTLGTRLDDC